MSGGSYNYLCFKDPGELANGFNEDMEKMRDRLIGIGAEDAARETEDLILFINAYKIRCQARIDRLTNVWKAIEWVDSCDSGPDAIEKALAEYRSEMVTS